MIIKAQGKFGPIDMIDIDTTPVSELQPLLDGVEHVFMGANLPTFPAFVDMCTEEFKVPLDKRVVLLSADCADPRFDQYCSTTLESRIYRNKGVTCCAKGDRFLTSYICRDSECEVDQKARTSFHEAGHAAVAILLGCPIYSACMNSMREPIKELKNGTFLGVVKHGRKHRQKWTETLQILIAGQLAAMMYQNLDPQFIIDKLLRQGFDGGYHARSDHSKVITLICTRDNEKEILKQARDNVVRLLEENWARVEALANRLLEVGHMSEDEIETVFQSGCTS